MPKVKEVTKRPSTKQADFLKGVNASFNFEKFSRDIFAKRDKDNTSFRDIQKLTGVSAATIYNAEAGIGSINVIALASLCNWLKVPVQTYFKS